MEIDQKVDVSAVNLEDLMNDDDSKEDVVKDEEEIESAEEDKPSKKKSKRNKKKKKKGLAAKIGLGFGATALAAVVTFGTISYFKGGKPSSQNSTEQSANQGAQSKTIGDAVFNVGDTLTIAGQDGKFLDDGSAVATDENGDLWLITADQMKQYAEKHPELFKKDKKDENKSTESKQENKSDANATSDKKDESKKDESKKDESKKDESKKDESKSNKKDESKSGN